MKKLIEKFSNTRKDGSVYYGLRFAGSVVGNSIVKPSTEYVDKDVYDLVEVGQEYSVK